MAPIPSLDELRSWLIRDQAALNAMSERLEELESMSAEELSTSGRNSLSTWDRSIVTECNSHLDAMEQIKAPSKQERIIMAELHKLVDLGDHMLERVNLMQATIKEKTAKSESARKPVALSKTAPADRNKEHEEEIKPQPKPELKVAASDEPHLPAHVLPPPLTSGAIVKPNNTLIYDLLGVSQNASSIEIKKAIRKQIMSRHPDRLPNDAEASTKFADFKILCAAIDKDESRREYDETGEVEDVDDLAGLVERLRLI
ncbi:hypothetical protein AMS68_006080 [Peltaster fructicola]|uniref:J domain-containing protein n=1 Tax=Peltaster fructicola TaxID=286661 RepID=A0A6H0Y0M7_9PEZI|nr:hypothetical protein AMS68_006080 [Peltaster fructicola]